MSPTSHFSTHPRNRGFSFVGILALWLALNGMSLPALYASTEPAGMELRGVLIEGDGLLFSINLGDGTPPFWLPLGATLNGVKAVDYDAIKSELRVLAKGREHSLKLSMAHLLASEPVVSEPPPTLEELTELSRAAALNPRLGLQLPDEVLKLVRNPTPSSTASTQSVRTESASGPALPNASSPTAEDASTKAETKPVRVDTPADNISDAERAKILNPRL